MEQAFERLEAAAASTEPADVALERLIGEVAEIAARYPLLERLICTSPPHRPGPRPEVRLIEAFAALVKRGREDGMLRPELRPETLALAAMGALFMALRLGSAADPRQVSTEVAAIVLDGARPDTSKDDSGE